MEIYEVMRCDKCEERYRGKFKVGRSGKVSCYISCDIKIKLEDITYKEVELEKAVLRETVKMMASRDIDMLYMEKREDGKDGTSALRDREGNIDPRKLYYQGNPIDLMIDLQDKAYKALTYIRMGQEEFIDVAENVYKLYIKAREHRYTVKELEYIEELITGEFMKCIESEVE